MKMYQTKQDAVYGLHQNGYTHDFQIAGNDLLLLQEKILVRAGDFIIDECHQFTDHSQKGTSMIVFGIAAPYHNVKGILIRHYTRNSLMTPPVILKKVKDMLLCNSGTINENFIT